MSNTAPESAPNAGTDNGATESPKAVGTASNPESDSGNESGDEEGSVEYWRKRSREHERRAKENSDKAKQFDELQEQSKTELQKAQERAEKAEKEREEALQQRLVTSLQATAGVSEDDAELWFGSNTEENLKARAAKLKELLGEKPPAKGHPAQTSNGERRAKSGDWLRESLTRR